MKLRGKKALVTGSSRGIGKGIALGLAEQGCDLVINYVHNQEAAENVAAMIGKIGRESHVLNADISNMQDVERLILESERLLGRIDILVNNAAITLFEPWSVITEEHWDTVLNTNLKGSFFCAQIAARGMIDRNISGSIINISSTNGSVAEADVLTYNVSKGGVEMLTKSLAVELAPHNIRVNSIAPGIIKTDTGDIFFADPAFREHYRKHIPLGRFGSVCDCAGAVIFLASDESQYITGASIVIDGGLLSDQCPKLS